MQRGDGDDMSRDDGDVMHRGDDDKEITNCSTGDSMPDGKQYLYSYEGSEITSLNWAGFTAEQHERNILPVKKKREPLCIPENRIVEKITEITFTNISSTTVFYGLAQETQNCVPAICISLYNIRIIMLHPQKIVTLRYSTDIDRRSYLNTLGLIYAN